MTEVGNRKKRKKIRFCSINFLNRALYRGPFFSRISIVVLSPKILILNVPRATEQHKVPLEETEARRPKALPESLSLSLSPLLVLCLFTTLSRLLYSSSVPCMCEEHCRRAMVEWVVYRVK